MARSAGSAQRGRLHALSAAFVGVGLVLAYRFADVQYLQHERFVELAREEHFLTESVPARRGALLDAAGRPLALTVLYDSVQLAGSEITEAAATAARLAPVLDMPAPEILAKIDSESKTLVPLKSRLSSPTAAQIEALRLPGVYLRQEPTRQYPEGSIAPQVLGFVG